MAAGRKTLERKADGPSRVKIDLFAPGSNPLYRAGVGGLAATVRWINGDGSRRGGVPGSLSFDDRSVELDWSGLEGPSVLLGRLYALAFQVADGLITLPGSYGPMAPPLGVKAALQDGMIRTFLQHGSKRHLSKTEAELFVEVDDKKIPVRFREATWYYHQDQYKAVTAGGRLVLSQKVDGSLFPGASERHSGLSGATLIRLPVGHAIASHFALVGTLSLPVIRGKGDDFKRGVLLIPDVTDLAEFAEARGAMTPRGVRECWVSGAADAALQLEVRLRQARIKSVSGVLRCYAQGFALNATRREKQYSRSQVITAEADDRTLDRFDLAMQTLPPRVMQGSNGAFWVDGVVRPFVAGNLAAGREWYDGFRLLVADKDQRKSVGYEKKGLQAMSHLSWDEREELIVKAMHRAMRQRYGAISEESGNNSAARNNRFGRQFEEWRIAFSGSKTPDATRRAFHDLFSRAGSNAVLKESWRSVAPLLYDDKRWQRNCDLALLALVTYQGAEKPPEQPGHGGEEILDG